MGNCFEQGYIRENVNNTATFWYHWKAPSMLFQNLIQKPWVTKGNDAKSAILGIELIPKKAFLLTYASIANFVDLGKIDQKTYQSDT